MRFGLVVVFSPAPCRAIVPGVNRWLSKMRTCRNSDVQNGLASTLAPGQAAPAAGGFVTGGFGLPEAHDQPTYRTPAAPYQTNSENSNKYNLKMFALSHDWDGRRRSRLLDAQSGLPVEASWPLAVTHMMELRPFWNGSFSSRLTKRRRYGCVKNGMWIT